MIIVYFLVIVCCGTALVAAIRVGKMQYKSFDKREDPLRILYPLSDQFAVIFEKIDKSINLKKNKQRSKSSLYNQELHRILLRKIATVLAITLVTSLIGILIAITSKEGPMESKTLSRPGVGQNSRKSEIQVYKENEIQPYKLDLTIHPQQFADSQVFENFNLAAEYLDATIPGKNASMDHITENLNLVTIIPKYGIEVTWQSNNYALISGDGIVKNEELGENSQGIMVTLKAKLVYEQYSQELEYNVVVYPKELDESQRFIQELKEEIAQADEDTLTQNVLTLPQEINGSKVSYSYKKENSSRAVVMLGVVAALAGVISVDLQKKKERKLRNKELKLQYAEVISKLTLLIGAGMTISSAWSKIVKDYQKQKATGLKQQIVVYEEMCCTMNQIESGKSEPKAYIEFGERCAIKEYMKLASLLEQNLRKGNKGLIELLENEAQDAFAERINIAKKQGEEAGTKMLLPMGLMLVVVMIIVITPAFMSFNI